jgi:2-polyprenyl-3-methyl-5-hydroxy-6-metoxy-1,4-benzoquinol methylase
VALEVGCAEGIFTGLLAGRAKEVVAFDISPTALQRARARCRDQANISFMVADLVTVEFERRFDVIVVTEVLGYLDERLTLPSLIKMTNWLHAGGILISNPAHGTEGNWQWLLKQSGLDIVAQQTVSCEGKECVILCAKKGEAADG